MKLFPVHPLLLSSLFILWISQSEAETNNPEVCQDEMPDDDVIPSEDGHNVEETSMDNDNNFICLLYPTNILNCSWSLQTLQKETLLSVNISIHDGGTADSKNHLSEERVGSWALNVHTDKICFVVLQFNITLHDKWTLYIHYYDIETLEVLSPPKNICVSVKDGDLFVEWSLSHSRIDTPPACFEYQLDLGDQEEPRMINRLNYTERNPDYSRTYRVKIRTKKADHCIGSHQWSEWSEAVKLEETGYELSTVAIISISLGIPMILLAVMLVCHQRVSKILFPPIPHPPQKYKCFLEKNDTFNFFHPALPAEPVEDFIHVEDTEQNPEKTFGK